MTSEAIRDPLTDHLLTPQNAAFVIIDYQPTQVNSIRSMDHDELVFNIVHTTKAALTYKLPIVLSTVNVSNGSNKPTIAPLMEVLGDITAYDRTTINAWEDVEFKKAVEATSRRKVIMTALWTEACLSFPTLDMLRDGYEVYAVVDAVGGTSPAAHETALRRIEQAGARLISKTQLYCELQRDWARKDTVPGFLDVFQKFDPKQPAKPAGS